MIGQAIHKMEKNGSQIIKTCNAIYAAPYPDEMGMGQEQYGTRLGMGQVWDRNGPEMGQVWDRMIQVEFMQMAYYPADSCAISPSAFLFIAFNTVARFTRSEC